MKDTYIADSQGISAVSRDDMDGKRKTFCGLPISIFSRNSSQRIKKILQTKSIEINNMQAVSVKVVNLVSIYLRG